MATPHLSTRDQFTADLRAALQVSSTANTAKTDAGRNQIFGVWSSFCRSVCVDPSLRDVVGHETKLSYLLVFGLRYRQEGQKNKSVRADTVTDALLAVGKGISDLGESDPRKEVPGGQRNHPLLAAFLKGLRNKDDPSSRSYPANVTILRNLYNVLDQTDLIHGQANAHVLNLTITAFYWLLRPAEYTASPDAGRSQAFRFCDVAFTVKAGAAYRTHIATDPSLNEVAETDLFAASLQFTDQKNGVRGEQVAQRATNDPDLCPARALFRLTQHLRDHRAPKTTPLCDYYDSHGKLSSIKSSFITNGLRHSAIDMKHLSGIDPFLLSARSL